MKIFGYIFILIFVVFFFILLYFSGVTLYSQAKIVLTEKRYDWQETIATKTKISLERIPNKKLSAELADVFPLKKCHIEYSYSFGGQEYVGTEVGLNQNKYKEEYLQTHVNSDLFDKLKDVKKFIVYVNPDNPKKSVLVKYDFDYKKLGKGLLLLIFPLVFLYIFYEYRKYGADYISSQIKLDL